MAHQTIDLTDRLEVIAPDAPGFVGYPLITLKTVFDAVCDPVDWKAPIAVMTWGENVNVIVAAIEFYTATKASVKLNVETMQYLIISIGYRAGPAGDH
jgi:hypothetical protein